MNIQGKGGEFVDDSLLSLTFSNEAINNIRNEVEAKGYIYTNQPRYMPDIPARFDCKFVIFSEHNTRLILLNRAAEERLPLMIAPSKIPKGGMGVFATANIARGTLVCSYLGEIGTHESIHHNDSTY